MILTKNSPEVAIIRDLLYRCRGMVLVPTMEKMVGQFVAEDFWWNHQKNQNDLDRQNEDLRLDEPCLRIGKIVLPEGFGK